MTDYEAAVREELLAEAVRNGQPLAEAAREQAVDEKTARKIPAVDEALVQRGAARELLVLLLGARGDSVPEICAFWESGPKPKRGRPRKGERRRETLTRRRRRERRLEEAKERYALAKTDEERRKIANWYCDALPPAAREPEESLEQLKRRTHAETLAAKRGEKVASATIRGKSTNGRPGGPEGRDGSIDPKTVREILTRGCIAPRWLAKLEDAVPGLVANGATLDERIEAASAFLRGDRDWWRDPEKVEAVKARALVKSGKKSRARL
jgi:hypothetical protein